MKIFYIKINNNEKCTKHNFKKLQSQIGRLITKFVAEYFYNIEDTSIIIENKKPKFENASLCFNISHSNNIVAVAFDSFPLGLDIEFMKDRDFKLLLERYNINSNNKEFFYQFWTEYEAKIKIQNETKQKISFKLEPNYMLSLFSSNPDEGIKTKLKIYELKSPIDNITPSELINLKLVKESNAKENTLVAQERSIAPDEFLTPLALNIE